MRRGKEAELCGFGRWVFSWQLPYSVQVVCTTNERLSDRSGVAGRIHLRAGIKLAEECRRTEGCHTGDAIVTLGHRLPASRVIHTVGPRFSVKYLTAAENALHACYRRSLERCVENKLRSVAFCVVNTESKGYPKEQAAHVAIRTVRRFLEAHGKHFDTVLLGMDNETDMAIYSAVLPLYFPR
jgi:O-acetyl-ADP-ribose deacetylase (regulator of RNase III)